MLAKTSMSGLFYTLVGVVFTLIFILKRKVFDPLDYHQVNATTVYGGIAAGSVFSITISYRKI